MRIIYVGASGVGLQSICLLTFILISRTSIAAPGKPVVICLAAAMMLVFLWREIRQAKSRLDLLLLPLMLSLGYVVAFHLVGLFWFQGLLKDGEWSVEYFLSLLRITGVVFTFYLICTLAIYFLNGLFRRRSVDLSSD